MIPATAEKRFLWMVVPFPRNFAKCGGFKKIFSPIMRRKTMQSGSKTRKKTPTLLRSATMVFSGATLHSTR
jgi:hypothetical protein